MVSRGSEWRRWEPHIHAPGTVLNNQFGGVDPWHTYLQTLETVTPKIEVIGVADYYVTETYEEVVRQNRLGRLTDVKLIFPNIEMRLDVAARNGFVNIHLLVSPEDPNHLTELKRLLSRLQFNVLGDRYDCTREELIRLGRRADPAIVDDGAALRHGATQYKVNFARLKEVFGESDWAKQNILVAVAGAADDGTSGLRQASDATMRQEIERFAHVIFSSSEAQREFWLGKRGKTAAELRDGYNGCKPCLHGSDAHHPTTVGQPTQNRYSWVKGALTFDALRQACIDPESRAFVGTVPPLHAIPSQVVSEVTLTDAPWATTATIPLNPGLVAVIGARGSGKTALADVIAAGCDAITGWSGDANVSPSFLVRARPLLERAKVSLTWGGGDVATRNLDGRDANGPFSYPRARYLSQQFVEELCSSQGASEGLIEEVERVVFEAHSEDQRDGATDFQELLAGRTMRFQQAQRREVEAIGAISDRIAVELEKESLVNGLGLQTTQKRELIKNYNTDLAKLVVKGSEVQANRHAQLNLFAQAVTTKIQNFQSQRRTFVTLQDEVGNMRSAKSPEMLRQVQTRYPSSGLSKEQWDEFLLVYQGDVEKSLTGYIAWVDQEVAKLQGAPPPPVAPGSPLIADAEDLSTIALSKLKAEMTRLEAIIGADAAVRQQYIALSARITQESATLKALEEKMLDAQGAVGRRKTLQTEREACYGRVIGAIMNEQGELTALYAPLLTRLQSSSGTLRKLGFTVTRIVDADTWGEFAEEKLIDRRKSGPFSGRGALIKVANAELKPSWEKGDAQHVQAAMNAFVTKYWKDFLVHAPYAPTQKSEYRTWLNQFAHWLYSTDHIKVRYEIEYDRVDIRKLSPGTRGIVLLLLYLALDEADDRPLIIDQPEENLDPKSVFDELVGLFVEAKKKRQVIIVTHNANLVVNTDADQIIIADAGPHPSGGLPPITYVSGGLEDGAIRRKVCDILEGGEVAFQERARRLRVRLER
jgi:energy-coupling factor transporter ATP-binding protein EcfA2